MKCPECHEKVIEYGDLLLHPINGCKIDDGCIITVDDAKTQEHFKILVKPMKELVENMTFKEKIYSIVYKYLKRNKPEE